MILVCSLVWPNQGYFYQKCDRTISSTKQTPPASLQHHPALHLCICSITVILSGCITQPVLLVHTSTIKLFLAIITSLGGVLWCAINPNTFLVLDIALNMLLIAVLCPYGKSEFKNLNSPYINSCPNPWLNPVYSYFLLFSISFISNSFPYLLSINIILLLLLITLLLWQL